MALSSQAQGRASDDALLSWFFWELLWTSRGSELPVQIVPDHIATLQERFDFITDHAISIGAIPAGSTKAVMQRLFEVYRTNWEAATQYNYEAKCPELDITLIRALEPLPPILRDMHDTIRSEYNDPLNGWAAKTSGMIKLIEVDGDHLTIMEEPFVGALVTAILEEIK
jgi:thioesterase domain-containing protein